MPNMGPLELGIIFMVVLIIFGPKSLPKIGQALGRGIREFKEAAKGLTSDDDDQTRRQAVPPPSSRDTLGQTPGVSTEQTTPGSQA